MGRVEGKVALITGAAHGQGRSHAVRLAQEGADIIAMDHCEDYDTVPYPMGSAEDLAETVRQVEGLGRRIVASKTDVRDFAAMSEALLRGVEVLGAPDIVAANAGIVNYAPVEMISDDMWNDVQDINLKGVWHTCKAAIPYMKAAEKGGSIVITSSVAGIKGWENQAHYVAAKHAVVGLMRSMARELAPHRIRVNTVHPTAVPTDMLLNDFTYQLFMPDADAPTLEDVRPMFFDLNSLPIPWVEPVDISNAVLFLASEEARYVTGIMLPVDAGCTLK